MNDASSRSHACFIITVFQQTKTKDNPEPPDPELLFRREWGLINVDADGEPTDPLPAELFQESKFPIIKYGNCRRRRCGFRTSCSVHLVVRRGAFGPTVQDHFFLCASNDGCPASGLALVVLSNVFCIYKIAIYFCASKIFMMGMLFTQRKILHVAIYANPSFGMCRLLSSPTQDTKA